MSILQFYTYTNVGLISLESFVWSKAIFSELDIEKGAEHNESLSQAESKLLLTFFDFVATEHNIPMNGSLNSLWNPVSITELLSRHGWMITAWSARDCLILVRKLKKKMASPRILQSVVKLYCIRDDSAIEILRNAYKKFASIIQSVSEQPNYWLVMHHATDGVI